VGVRPTFQRLLELPLYGREEFAEALDFLRLSAGEGATWGAAGPQRETPPGSEPGQVTVVRGSARGWQQVLGPTTEPSGEAVFPKDVVNAIAAEPGGERASERAWMGLDTTQDAAQPSPTAPAIVASIAADGTISGEDEQQLPSAREGIGPKGAAAKIACPAPHDCWLATTQGWLFHLTNGREGLPVDSDPAFSGPITERPPDEGLPQVPPDAPPPDTSGLLGEPPPSLGPLTETPRPVERVAVPLLSHIHTRVVHGSTLELRFHLAVRARIRLLAERHRAVVASTPTRTLAAGNRKLLLRLNTHRWPTKLELKTHALAPLPTVAASAGATETVSTRLVVLPKLSGLLH
jgi:hypothetical protein